MTEIKHYERLSCGHQNNLLIGGKTGICPKGCLTSDGKTILAGGKPIEIERVAFKDDIEVKTSWDNAPEELKRIKKAKAKALQT